MALTVGCETNWEVTFVDRFTGKPADMGDFVSVSGAWKLDSAVTVNVVFAKTDCCPTGFSQVRPWRYNLLVKRDGRLVHYGPITTRREKRTTMVYQSTCLLGWTKARWMGGAGSLTGTSAEIVAYVLNRTLGNPLDPIPWQSRIEQTSDVRTVTWGATATGYDVLRQVLDTSLDLFAVGDTIYSVPSNRKVVGTLTENDVSSEFESFDDGWAFGTRTVAGSGDTVATAGGADPYWGLVDRTIGNATQNTSETPQAVADDLLEEARGAGMILVPGSSGNLNPGVNLDLFDLLPGNLYKVELSDRCAPMSDVFEVVETPWVIDGKDRTERISVALRELVS